MSTQDHDEEQHDISNSWPFPDWRADVIEWQRRRERTRALRAELKRARDAGLAARHARKLRRNAGPP